MKTKNFFKGLLLFGAGWAGGLIWSKYGDKVKTAVNEKVEEFKEKAREKACNKCQETDENA